MAFASKIAPITGRFKNRVIRDVTGSVVLGSVLAFSFWYGYAQPKQRYFKEFDAKNKAKALEEEKAWMTENN
ncbi:hypothetical protein HDU91_001837, partial [Kappamyces sp. JEL0680]